MFKSITEFLVGIPPVYQALLATLFTWGVTALGAGLVLFTRRVGNRFLDTMLGMAAGVMIAASYWSLLAPAIEMSEGSWVPATVGFLAGAGFLAIIDKIIPHLHIGMPTESAEGIHTNWHRSILLVMAITLHNIPEGLAVGVAFGAAAQLADVPGMENMLSGAVALAIGIGLQNFPEGMAVSMPLRREGMGRGKAFWYGQLSGVVEPIAGVIGAGLVLLMAPILPYALAFAAGAMIFVVVEELIPESQTKGNTDLATLGTIAGFAFMMTLDVALG